MLQVVGSLAGQSSYARGLDRVQRWVAPYLDATASSQIWQMFGGTPPRAPLVFVVEVRAAGARDFVRFKDLRWGTADTAAMNFVPSPSN